jgi:hypothetical protein
LEVLGRVLARRGIATADMAARLALAKSNPNSSREFSARENPRVFRHPLNQSVVLEV